MIITDIEAIIIPPRGGGDPARKCKGKSNLCKYQRAEWMYTIPGAGVERNLFGLKEEKMDGQSVDLVLVKGRVITLDGRDTIAEAVAVGEGRIVQVGSTEEIGKLAGGRTQTIDLKNKALVPGFIDAHTHIDMYGMMTSDLVADCHSPPLGSVEDILEGIREKAASRPPGALILGQGRPFQPYPTKEQIDEAAPDHPVIIKASMHWYLLNDPALKKFHITKDAPTPEALRAIDPCGFIQKDGSTGEPTGYVEECWNYMFPRSHSPFNDEQTRRVIKEGLDKASRYGITSVGEFQCHPESMRIYQDLHKTGQLHTRLQLIPCFYGVYKTVELDEVIHTGVTSGFGNEWVKFGGLKVFLDTHQLKTSCTPLQLNEWFGRAHRAGLRMFMHAISRGAQDMALRSMEAEAAETGIEGVREMRHRIEHMGNENHDPGFFQRTEELNAIAVPTAYFMNMGPGTLVSPKTDKSFMFRTLLDMGLCVPGNSDTAGAVPEALNPMYQIWCMVNRKSLEGELVSPSEKLSVLEALKVYTIHSAYAGCEEKTKGSIEVGKLADFAVLAKDPLAVPEDDLKNIDVEMTIVGGKVVYRNT